MIDLEAESSIARFKEFVRAIRRLRNGSRAPAALYVSDCDPLWLNEHAAALKHFCNLTTIYWSPKS